MAKEITTYNREDRDLLIELKTTMKAVRDDIQSLKDGVGLRLTNLEKNSVNNVQFEDHETRIRTMEKYQWLQMGAAGLLGAILSQLANLAAGTLHL